MPGEDFKIVAMAASAGGLRAISAVLTCLPAGFAGALVVVQHLDRRYPSQMAEILSRRTALQVKQAAEGDRLAAGHAFIAKPDRHLLVNEDGTLSLSQTKLVHFVRPSADLLFESAAASHGPRVIAVVLSGTGTDGALGLEAVKKMGGTVIVEQPSSAQFAGMPSAAVHTGTADFVLPLEQIGPMLTALADRVASE
jgi:two-component system, chemotaxis family, protein-glutamate methylesterase/glutaminase